jgi:riboflavin transporter FmnP
LFKFLNQHRLKKGGINMGEEYQTPTVSYLGVDQFIIPAIVAAVVVAAKAVAATSAVKAVALAVVTGAAAGTTNAVVSKMMS